MKTEESIDESLLLFFLMQLEKKKMPNEVLSTAVADMYFLSAVATLSLSVVSSLSAPLVSIYPDSALAKGRE